MALLTQHPLIQAATGQSDFDLGNALGTKNGYQAQMAPGTIPQLQGAQGSYNSNMANQMAFMNALNAQAQGGGPNPAQAMLNQATDKNIAQNSGMIASQKGINPALAIRMAGQNAADMSQQAAGQGAVMGAQQQLQAQNQLGNLYGQIGNQALNQQNIAQEGFYAPQNINAGIAAGNAANNAQMVGGLANAGAKAFMASHGGTVPGYAGGGSVIPDMAMSPGVASSMSNTAKFFNQNMGAQTPNVSMPGSQPEMMSNGGKVPGKAPVFGDHEKNDIVAAKLSPGEIVIPRTILMGPNPAQAAAAFVEQELAKNGGPEQNYADGGVVTPFDQAEFYQKQGFNPDGSLQVPESSFEYLTPAQERSSGVTDRDMRKNYVASQMPSPLASENDFSAPQVSAPSVESPAKVVGDSRAPTQATSGADTAQPGMGKGLGMIQSGMQKEAQAIGAQGRQEADIYAKQAEQARITQEAFAKTQAEYMNEIKQASKDFQEQKINPRNYFDNLSTGQKFSNAIGLLLGGIGSGLTGKENVAIAHIDKAIDNDIKAQMANMDKKSNLMRMNMQLLGNEMDAAKMTKAMQLDVFNNQLQQAAAQAKDPLAQARLMQESGKIQMQVDKLSGEIAMKKALAAGQPVNPEGLPEEQRERYIQGDEYGGLARTPQEGIKFREGEAAYKNSVRGLGRLMEITKSSTKSLSPETIAEVEQIRAMLGGDLRESVLGPGTVNEAERAILMDKVLANPSSLTSLDSKTKVKLQGLINTLQSKRKDYAQSIGLRTKGAGSDRNSAKVGPMQQQAYQWAKANPKNPTSAKIMSTMKDRYGVE